MTIRRLLVILILGYFDGIKIKVYRARLTAGEGLQAFSSLCNSFIFRRQTPALSEAIPFSLALPVPPRGSRRVG